MIALALLLVPTAVNSKTCESDLKYETAALHNMVQSCFNHLNMNSIQMFGAPIIPIFGINQCVCIADKIRRGHECVEDYMILVANDTASELLGKYSIECILEGAMGEAARKAYIGETDNATKDTYPPATKEKEELKKDTNSKKPITWDDLINK
jgi:hypothetical protein